MIKLQCADFAIFSGLVLYCVVADPTRNPPVFSMLASGDRHLCCA